MREQVYKLEIFLPEAYKEAVFQALWSVDAGHIGNYDRCLSCSPVVSCWRSSDCSKPFHGKAGEMTWAEEIKVEVCCLESRLAETLDAVKQVHPYEEPVINVLPLIGTGL